MTIITHGNEWNVPLLILTAYIVSGFIVIFMLPESVIILNKLHIDRGIFGEVASIAKDQTRASFYFVWMLALLPIVFMAFSISAPIKLKLGTKPTASAFITLVIAFIVFGIVSSPYLAYYALLGTTPANPSSRLDRLAYDMARDDFSMFYGTSILFCVFIVTSWISYVALPVSFVKMLKLRHKS